MNIIDGRSSFFRLKNRESTSTENEASSSIILTNSADEDVLSPPVVRLRRSANNFKTPIQHSGKYSDVQLSSKRQTNAVFL